MTQQPLEVVINAIKAGASAANVSEDRYLITPIDTKAGHEAVLVKPIRQGAVGAIVDVGNIAADCYTVDIYIEGDDVPIEIIGPEDVNQTVEGISAASVVEHTFRKLALGEVRMEDQGGSVSYDVQPITDRTGIPYNHSGFSRWG